MKLIKKIKARIDDIKLEYYANCADGMIFSSGNKYYLISWNSELPGCSIGDKIIGDIIYFDDELEIINGSLEGV
jgi:hypothetical protein